MRKLLLGSTALVAGGLMAAPAMAADPIKIGVGGYYTFYAIGGNISSTYAFDGSVASYKGVNIIQEGEIHFIGSTKLDNGTTVGLTVELEGGAQAAGFQIDEAFLFSFGSWGRIEMGARDQATYRMLYGTPAALIGFGFFQHNHNWINPQSQGFNKSSARITGLALGFLAQDVNRINYFTPRFAGLQIGMGYAPKVNNVGTAGSGPNVGAGVGVCGFAAPANPGNCATSDYSYQDVFDIGANYLNKFGDVTIALYGAFMYGNFVPGNNPFAPSASIATGFNLASAKQWGVGAQIGFAGFTLGGGYTWDNNGLGSNYYTGTDNDTRTYSVGVMYETGPWQMSVGWIGARNNNGNGSASVTAIAAGTNALTVSTPANQAQTFGTNFNNNRLFGAENADKFELGANYALGPGVKLVGGAFYNKQTGPSNLTNGEAWALLIGMDLRF